MRIIKNIFGTIAGISLFGTIGFADTNIMYMFISLAIFVLSFLMIRTIEKIELKKDPNSIKNCIMYHYDEKGNMLNKFGDVNDEKN